jgi:hypothetical protein
VSGSGLRVGGWGTCGVCRTEFDRSLQTSLAKPKYPTESKPKPKPTRQPVHLIAEKVRPRALAQRYDALLLRRREGEARGVVGQVDHDQLHGACGAVRLVVGRLRRVTLQVVAGLVRALGLDKPPLLHTPPYKTPPPSPKKKRHDLSVIITFCHQRLQLCHVEPQTPRPLVPGRLPEVD